QIGLQDVHAVDPPDGADRPSDLRRGDDFSITLLTRLRGELLRIVETCGNAVRVEHDTGRHDRTGPRPASRFVDACHLALIFVHQFRFEVEAWARLWG